MSDGMSGHKNSRQGKQNVKMKLPLAFYIFLWGTYAVLAGGHLVYDIGLFDIATVDDCRYEPSDIDEGISDARVLASILLGFFLYASLKYLHKD